MISSYDADIKVTFTGGGLEWPKEDTGSSRMVADGYAYIPVTAGIYDVKMEVDEFHHGVVLASNIHLQRERVCTEKCVH